MNAQAFDCRGVFCRDLAMLNACVLLRKAAGESSAQRNYHLLCHKQDVYCSQIKLVVERKGC